MKVLIFVTLLCQILLASSMMTGGKNPIGIDELLTGEMKQYVKEGLAKGIEMFNRMSNSINKYQILGLVSVTSQVVEGMSYDVKVLLGATNCPNQESTMHLSSSVCGFQQNAAEHGITKTFNIWVRIWKPRNEQVIVKIV